MMCVHISSPLPSLEGHLISLGLPRVFCCPTAMQRSFLLFPHTDVQILLLFLTITASQGSVLDLNCPELFGTWSLLQGL